jgi:peptide methionine sulfoxide reductase MsrA
MQYPDIGTQYRSEIFYENGKQKILAIKTREKISLEFKNKIETNISKIKNYCKAEEYHQKFIEKKRR